MKRRLTVAALCLAGAGSGWSLDAESQKLADRYRALVVQNPAQKTAFDRLWKIYADAGETEGLMALARGQAEDAPAFYARVLVAAGRAGEAEKFLEHAATSGSLAAAEMWSVLLEDRGEFAAAAGVLEQAAEGKTVPALLVRQGELWAKAGEADKARAAWEEAVILAPEDLVLRKKLAAVDRTGGSAIGHLRVLAEKGSPTERFEAWEEISRRQEEAGDLAEALAAQESLLALMGPGHWKLAAARRRLLDLHQRNGTLPDLEKAWEKEAGERPRDPDPLLRLAQLQEFEGDEAGRLVWLRRATERLPGDLTLLTRVAALELAQGHPEEAARLYDRVLGENPGAADVVFLRAEIDALSGREAEAEKRVGEFLAARPDDAAAAARAQEFYRRMHLSRPLERMLRVQVSARPGDVSAVRELGQFYLTERRFSEAATALEQWDDSSPESEEFAATAMGFSEMLHQAGVTEEALEWARKAVARQPANADAALHLADLLAASDRTSEVPDVLQAACAAAAPALPREDLDRRLFLALQAAGTEETSLLPDSSKRVREKIALLQEAVPGGGEADWRRLARWRRWQEGGAGAAETLREAVNISDSPVLREELAAALAEAGDGPAAIAEYRLLLESQPDQARTWRRQIGHLQMDAGAVDDGLATFEDLAADREDDWQAVADLALAEQRAGNWFRALETWQRACRLAPPDARAGLIPPVLNAAARLQLAVRGLDFLEELAAQERDVRTREELLREAARFAKTHKATAEWRDRLGRRLESAPQDRGWRMGMAFLLEEEGRSAEARQVLAEGLAGGEDAAEDLQEAAAVAEKAEDWDETVRLVKRLAALENPPSVATALRLAEILERAGRREAAREAWEGVARRYARSPEALTAAAEFFDRTGDEVRMEACYRAAVQLGGCPPQVLLRLGRLALERGDRMRALDDFEMLLATTRPDPGFLRDGLPLPERILSTKEPAGPTVSFLPSGHRTQVRPAVPWRRVGESETGGCRLLAIREAATLLANSPDKTRWLGQFSHPIEGIWARYYSGDIAQAFARILEETDDEDSASWQQSYAALAMECGRETELAAWAGNDPETPGERWDHVLAAFTRMLEAGWRPSEEAGQRLFSSAPALSRWQAARALAGHQQFRAADLLGQTVPSALKPSQATPAWLELAGWNLDRRHVPSALACLDRAVEGAAPAVSFADPFFAALRARWLLTLPEERADFEKKLAARWRAQGSPACEAAGRALLAALKDHPGDAAREVERLFSLLGHAEEEGWAEVVQRGGAQVEEWNLPRLARALYREDLARDPALQVLRGENFRRATEALWIFNRLGTASEASAGYVLNEWLARGVSDEELLQATVRLQQMGRVTTAARAFQILCDRNPGDPSVVAGIINLTGLPAMRPAARAFLERFLARSAPQPNPVLWDNAALRLAGFLEEDGESARALEWLEKLSANRPDRAAQVVVALCRMGRFREALLQLENQPQDVLPVHQQMDPYFQAELYAAFGRDREARALRDKAVSRPAGVRRLEVPGVSAVPGSRAPSDWIGLLDELDARPLSVSDRFRAGRDFLLAHRDLPSDLQIRELARLQKLARRESSLQPDFYLLRRDLASSPEAAHALESDWLAEWDSGRGAYLAGEMLVQRYLAQKRFDDLAKLLGVFLTDRHFQEAAWNQIGQRLLEAGQPALAVRVFSALMARAPGDTSRALDLATGLWKSGRRAVAREVLVPVVRIAAVDPQKHADLARFYLRVDEPGEALPHLLAAESLLRGDPGLGGLWAAAARSFLAAGQLDQARAALTRAALGPQTLPAQTVGEYYQASGNLPPQGNDFALPPRLWREVQVDVLQRLLGAGDQQAAWLWLENHPTLLQDTRARNVFQALEATDYSRAGRIWEVALQTPVWEVQADGAQFFLRRARVLPASALSDLDRAHALNPGSFAIAKSYAEELLNQNKPAEAQRVLQDVVSGYALPADRLAAREMLVRLQASPALPNKG